MLGALVAVSVVAFAALVGLIVSSTMLRRRSAALLEANESVIASLADSRSAEEERDAAVSLAEAAEIAEREAESLAVTAIERAERAEQEARQAREELERAEEDAQLESQAGGFWVLEAMRLERRWLKGVAPGSGSSPFDGSQDPARAALEILVEAMREEVGASFDLTWSSSDAVPVAAALRLARSAEELLAEASAATDGGELEVEGIPGGLVLRITTEPAFELSAELVAALEVFGGMALSEDGAVVVEISWAELAE